MSGLCAVDVDLAGLFVIEIIYGNGERVAVVAVHGEHAAALVSEQLFGSFVGNCARLPAQRSKHGVSSNCMG